MRSISEKTLSLSPSTEQQMGKRSPCLWSTYLFSIQRDFPGETNTALCRRSLWSSRHQEIINASLRPLPGASTPIQLMKRSSEITLHSCFTAWQSTTGLKSFKEQEQLCMSLLWGWRRRCNKLWESSARSDRPSGDGEGGKARRHNASVTSTTGSLQPTALMWQDYSSAELKVRWPEKVTELINHIWPGVPQTAALSVCAPTDLQE